MIEQTNSEILLLNSLFLFHYIPYRNIEKIYQNGNKNRRNSGMEFSFFPSSTGEVKSRKSRTLSSRVSQGRKICRKAESIVKEGA